MIRTLNQFDIERAIMVENSTRLSIIEFLYWESLRLTKLDYFLKKEVGKQIISQGAVWFEGESDINTLLSLFNKHNPTKIYHLLDIVLWQSDWKRSVESKSSSFSGLKFGHYLSQALDLIMSDTRLSLINLEIWN